MRATLVLIAALIAPGAALAEDKVDCKDPQTQMDMNYCADQGYKAADMTLNAAYKKATASMKETDSYLPEDQKGATAALLAAQRAWIDYRDKACKSEAYLVKGGSMEPMIYAECMTRITKERTAALGELTQGMGN